ncbi:ATP-binding protein [Pseudoalteromonas sp. MMG010]|uniref:ATP-binding protein n=1 Tax=Pseudoalteromonas sp. MMG010 TaxID=2822685 RepID=UPI001FFD42C9|nr:ATP-binding protein [Pseudoalteromonas sp. MMG010]
MFTLFYLSFTQGFEHFIKQEETKHVARVKQQLIKLYSELGSWQPVTHNIELWRSIVEPKKAHSTTNKQRNNNQPPTPSFLWISLPAGSLKTGQRISLYDANKQVIVGRTLVSENSHVEPILLQNEIIGWLGLVPSKNIQSSPAKAFLTTQFHNYFMISLFVILLAFIMAIILSRHLTKPIKQLLNGTNELIHANFKNRITPVTKDEIGTLSNNLNKLAETLEHNQQERQQWVSNTSHELKTPLTVLHSHLIAIQDGVFTADPKRISVLLNQVDNLKHIVDDLAQLAQADTLNLTYHTEQIDLISTLEQALHSYGARFNEKQLTVNTHQLKSTDTAFIQGDKSRLKQLFTNLLENSCRYTQAGGQISIAVNKTKHTIELILQDSAPGVTEDELKQLFERFYRVEKSRSREHGGSGLGLSLCLQIAKAHNAHIKLAHSALGGLKVTLIFKRLQ